MVAVLVVDWIGRKEKWSYSRVEGDRGRKGRSCCEVQSCCCLCYRRMAMVVGVYLVERRIE
jgi:hypothetical protein